MADLSPQARAVLDAVKDAYWSTDGWKHARVTKEICPNDAEVIAAAALRAVVEHLSETHAGFDLADRYGRFVEADDILAIAAELEGAQ